MEGGGAGLVRTLAEEDFSALMSLSCYLIVSVLSILITFKVLGAKSAFYSFPGKAQ